MDPRVAPLHATLRLNTRLLLNCLDGLDDTAGGARPKQPRSVVGGERLLLAPDGLAELFRVGEDALDGRGQLAGEH